MAYKAFDLDIFPGAAALQDAVAQGFSWCAAYLPAPSHRDAGWPGYVTLKATGINILPVWVGAQVIGPGSHAVGGPDGMAEGRACVAELTTRGYPIGTGVVFDTENGAPVQPVQLAHLENWASAVSAGGYRPMVYGSYENFAALEAIVGRAAVWEFELLGGPPNNYLGVAIQYEQEVPLTLAGKTYSVDRSVSVVADPAAPLPFVAPLVLKPTATLEGQMATEVTAAQVEAPSVPAAFSPALLADVDTLKPLIIQAVQAATSGPVTVSGLLTDTKSIWSSKTFWGIVVIGVATGAQQLGYNFTTGEQSDVINDLAGIIQIGGAMFALYGRIMATKTVK